MIRHLARRAFTLVELLVVIAIFVLLLAIAVPAFSNMLYSSEQSLADNALRSALTAARDAAARNGPEQDAAAVFTFEPDGRLSVLTCVRAGVIEDVPPLGARATVTREVFVPLAGFLPIQMPRGWMVRGYAPPNSVDDGWYEDTYLNTGPLVVRSGNWVFPETGFF
ncbi:MAG: type II secretion system protein, partial [Phycisphaerales bacterium]